MSVIYNENISILLIYSHSIFDLQFVSSPTFMRAMLWNKEQSSSCLISTMRAVPYLNSAAVVSCGKSTHSNPIRAKPWRVFEKAYRVYVCLDVIVCAESVNAHSLRSSKEEVIVIECNKQNGKRFGRIYQLNTYILVLRLLAETNSPSCLQYKLAYYDLLNLW
jgi:sulfur relay (sulfurtransferase) DsrF/TusC family protein